MSKSDSAGHADIAASASDGQPTPGHADIAASSSDGQPAPKVPSKKQRKLAQAHEHMEQKKMQAAEKESCITEAFWRLLASASSSSHEAPELPPQQEPELPPQQEPELPPQQAFAVGQSVLQWWAPWMQKCVTTPSQLKKANRPSWYSGEVICYSGFREDFKYAGATTTTHTYKVN